MARPRSYPDEFRERAVRLVREWRAERGLSDGGLTVVAAQLGLHRETLRRWVLEQEVDGGRTAGAVSSGAITDRRVGTGEQGAAPGE